MKRAPYLFSIVLLGAFNFVHADTSFVKTAPKQGKHYVSGIVTATVAIDKNGNPTPPQWEQADAKLMKLAQEYRFPPSYRRKQQCNPQGECVPISHTETYRWIFVAPKIDKAIRIIRRVKPVYPERARENKEEGEVSVGMAIAPDGKVAHVSIMQSSGSLILDKAALLTAYQFQFSPITYAGKPVYHAWIAQSIKFRLEE
ncbi:energy transducer TonB [Neisseriaceae bacterium B1]